MSACWYFHCDSCDTRAVGAVLCRKPGGVQIVDPDALAEFLIEHDFHDVGLVHE